MLAAIVYIADRVTAELGFGFRGDVPSTEIEASVLVEIGMTGEQLKMIKQNLPQAFEEIEATFN